MFGWINKMQKNEHFENKLPCFGYPFPDMPFVIAVLIKNLETIVIVHIKYILSIAEVEYFKNSSP